MHALRLTTRFKDGTYQGEACLLVYDEQRLSATMLSEDVRDQFESRPATARIYVLAPFNTEEEVRTSFTAGALFERIRSYFHVLGGRLYLLNFRKHEAGHAAIAIPFKSDDHGNPVEEPPVWLEKDLQDGWLFDLFDRYRGRLDAPIGVHFGKSSGKHSDKFLRASSILLSSTACAAIAYFTLGTIGGTEPKKGVEPKEGARLKKGTQPKRIFVDTAPLISVAFALQRIALKNKLWELETPVDSFSSYGGISRLPRPSGKDLILVSASTSGGLVSTLKEKEFEIDDIATLFYLESTMGSKTEGNVICDLTFKVGNSYGYPEIKSYKSDDCPFCEAGYFLAELEGDQFLLEKRAIKRLAVKANTQTKDSREWLEHFARKQLFHVKLFAKDSSTSEFIVNSDELLTKVAEVRSALIRGLRRYIPLPINYVVLDGITRQAYEALVKDAGVSDLVQTATVIEHGELGNAPNVANGSAMVIFGLLDNFARARNINAQLRTVVPKGCVSYLSALTVANSVEQLNDLRTFLTFGEQGRDTFTYYAASSFMLPKRIDEVSPWEAELQFLRQEREEAKLPAELEARLDVLTTEGMRTNSLFWPGKFGELDIKNDFVYLNTTVDREAISQADIYATVSNLLAAVRADNRGLTSAVQIGKQPIHWHQSVYGHALLDPSNFEIYNDAVLRAAFLRGANASELQYFSDAHSSARVYSVIQAAVLSWEQGGGDALPEFLISLVTKRLTLCTNHMAELKKLIIECNLPDYLKYLGNNIQP